MDKNRGKSDTFYRFGSAYLLSFEEACASCQHVVERWSIRLMVVYLKTCENNILTINHLPKLRRGQGDLCPRVVSVGLGVGGGGEGRLEKREAKKLLKKKLRSMLLSLSTGHELIQLFILVPSLSDNNTNCLERPPTVESEGPEYLGTKLLCVLPFNKAASDLVVLD